MNWPQEQNLVDSIFQSRHLLAQTEAPQFPIQAHL